jgi:hypothetical protein
MIVHQRWTNTDLIDLRAGLRERGTIQDIAVSLGRTPEAVEIMMKRLRLSAAPPL